MNHSVQSTATIDAERRVATAIAQVIRYDMPEEVDSIKSITDSLYLNMSLTPRPRDARACFPQRWRAQRFERIGEVFFVPPGEAMHVRSECGHLTTIVCQLDSELMTKWFERKLDWTEARLEAGLDISDRSIRGMLLRMTRELVHPGFASDVIIELIAAQLAIELGRHCAAVANEPPRNGLAAWRLRMIDERVSEIGKAPSLGELAELCNLSVRQLSRGFRISRDRSIGDYVEETRIENAKRLLISGKSVKSVAYSMGFSSPSSFSYAFRRATGATPAAYRDRV